MSRVVGLCVVLAALIAPSVCRAGVVYNYSGKPFTDAPLGNYFQPGDSVSGYVQFSSAPAPNDTLDATNIEDFSLSTGWRTTFTFLEASSWNAIFHFDGAGQIDWWDFSAVGPLCFISTTNSAARVSDEARAMEMLPPPEPELPPMELEHWGYVDNNPGVWVAAVPEPSTIVLWSLMGVVGIGLGCWRKRRQ